MRDLTHMVLALCLVACGDRTATVERADAGLRGPAAVADAEGSGGGTRDAADASAAPADAARRPPTCAERREAASAAILGMVSERNECRWDHECVLLPLDLPCAPASCPTAVHARHLVAAREALEAIGEEHCVAGCEVDRSRECPEQVAHCRGGRCGVHAASAEAPPRPETVIPEQNARARDDDPPPRPPAGDAEARMRRLFEAIVHDDPQRAVDAYLPREAFLELKGIADPGGYWDRLFPRFLRDIHALHEALPELERAEFVRLELVRRGGWVRLREEGNMLPYHVSRHSWIHYRVGDEERRLEVRVLITWGDQWYVTHLCEFHCEERECCRAPE